MKYNLLKHKSSHSTTYRVTSYLNTTCLTHFHIIHVPKDQNTIPLNQSISINTQALCNKYTKTQSYMQYGIMSVKNFVGHPDFIYELYKTHDSSIIFKINLTRLA